MSRNIFDYIEISFKKIFCLEGVKKLQLSFLVGISFTLLQIALFFGLIAIGLSHFHQITSWYEILPLTITILGIYTLVALTLLFIEKSFYSIIMPHCFYGNTEVGGFKEIYEVWKQFFGKYFTYITYYSLAMIALVTLFVLVYIGFFVLEKPDMILIVSIVAVFMYVYVNVRLVLAWYSVFFLPSNNFNYLRNSWHMLKGKVWSTFIKTCVFFFIVGTGSGVSTYMAQLFLPDMSEELLNELEKLSQLTSAPQIQDIQNVFQTFAGPFLYSLIVLMIFYKVAYVFTEAMRHVFLIEYYKDISNANLPQITESQSNHLFSSKST